MNSGFSDMVYEPRKLKNYLIERLDHLLLDMQMQMTMHNKEQVRGNCNEIELMLINLFGMNMNQIDLIEEKAIRFAKYTKMKSGGYCLTSDDANNYFWLKDGNRVEPQFWLPDNGISDKIAVEAAYEFKTWLEETKITKLEWMIEADIIYPAIEVVEKYSLEEFEESDQ